MVEAVTRNIVINLRGVNYFPWLGFDWRKRRCPNFLVANSGGLTENAWPSIMETLCLLQYVTDCHRDWWRQSFKDGWRKAVRGGAEKENISAPNRGGPTECARKKNACDSVEAGCVLTRGKTGKWRTQLKFTSVCVEEKENTAWADGKRCEYT